MPNKTPRVVTLGGGTGAPIVLQALNLAGVKNISAISASMDSGGKTGHLRSDERDQVIAISDLLRNLLALIHPHDTRLTSVQSFIDLLKFTDGRNRNLGYVLYYALMEMHQNDYLAVQTHLENLLGIKFNGRAIPVTLDPVHISFTTTNHQIYHGEHELDRQSMSANTITRIWFDKPAAATPEAIIAIKNATHIIFSPGSIYGSVLSNFLPLGITAALKKSKAQKILITNLVSDRNQTHSFLPLDFYSLFARQSGMKSPFSVVISPDLSRLDFETLYPRVVKNYALEHSHFLGWPESDFNPLNKKSVKVIRAPVFSITPTLYRIRHDPAKLAKVFKKLL